MMLNHNIKRWAVGRLLLQFRMEKWIQMHSCWQPMSVHTELLLQKSSVSFGKSISQQKRKPFISLVSTVQIGWFQTLNELRHKWSKNDPIQTNPAVLLFGYLLYHYQNKEVNMRQWVLALVREQQKLLVCRPNGNQELCFTSVETIHKRNQHTGSYHMWQVR